MKLAQLGQRQSKQPSQLVLLSVFFRTWRGNWECNTGRSSLYDLFESGRLLVRREVRALQKNRPNDTAIKPGVRSRVERNKQSVRKEKNLKKEKRKDGNGNLSMNRFWFWPLWLLKKPPQVLHWHLAVGGTLGDPQSFPGRKKRPPLSFHSFLELIHSSFFFLTVPSWETKGSPFNDLFSLRGSKTPSTGSTCHQLPFLFSFGFTSASTNDFNWFYSIYWAVFGLQQSFTVFHKVLSAFLLSRHQDLYDCSKAMKWKRKIL